MPAVKRKGLSGLVGSDIEDSQFCEMPTPDSAIESRPPPAKKARGRPKAAPTKVTKTKAPARRTSGRLTAKATAAAKAAPKGKRQALADKTNQQNDGEAEEVDDFEQDPETMEGALVEKLVPAKQTKANATKKRAAAPRAKPVNEVSRIEPVVLVVEDSQAVPKQNARTGKKGRPRKEIPGEPSPEKVIQETQEQNIYMDGMDGDIEEEAEEVVTKTAHQVIRSSSHSRSRQPSTQRRRAGSASDTERSDPTLRRKLGEMTKNYESLKLKYQDLREIGVKEAEKNFNQLKTRNEAEKKASENVIASLKGEVQAQKALAKEAQGLKKKIDSQTSDLGALRLQVEQLTASLSEAQSQNKTLSAKLAANRTAAASVESANAPKVPGSAIKANGSIRMIGSAEAAQAAQAAQLKEDLYSDLTGLIVRSVKREAEEDVFDCIQTGRNGTLHFKLATANEKASESYDDAQCNYIPQLDPSRDKMLMELLPEYLIDEISFPRQQAAKFYARVVKALTEKQT